MSPRPAEESPWPSFLHLLVGSLGAASAAIWRLDPEGEVWESVAEHRREGWSGPARSDVPRRGHPFSWSAREDLVLQIPGDRIREGRREGWVLVVPGPGGRLLVELWFASAPGSAVREAADAIREHLRWLGAVGEEPDLDG